MFVSSDKHRYTHTIELNNLKSRNTVAQNLHSIVVFFLQRAKEVNL